MRRGRAHTNLFSGSNLLPVAELKYGGILFTRKLEQKSGAKAENEMEKKEEIERNIKAEKRVPRWYLLHSIRKRYSKVGEARG